MKAELKAREISYGRNTYRFNGKYWFVHAFGTTVFRQNTPHWSWIQIDEEKVPKEVRNMV